MNDKLADLTPAEIAEAALANPQIAQHVASKDSRVILMEKLYGDDDAKEAIQKHSKRLFPKASVPEVDIPEKVRASLKDDIEAWKALKAEVDEDKKVRRHEAFRARLQEAGAQVEDLEAIETFMVENEIGPKSLTVAVEKYYESKDLAEPRGAGLSPEMPLDSQKDEQMKALLAAGPSDDLDAINTPFVESIFNDMFGGKGKGRR